MFWKKPETFAKQIMLMKLLASALFFVAMVFFLLNYYHVVGFSTLWGGFFSTLKLHFLGQQNTPSFVRLHVRLSHKKRISRVGHVAGPDTKPFGLFRCPERPVGGDCSPCPSSRPKSLTCLCDGIIVGALEPRQ